MESEDADRNRFVLDVTKTAFLREGFSISRVGGSAVDGATAPNEKGEKGEKGKRASSRPSSGKVGVSGRGKILSFALETLILDDNGLSCGTYVREECYLIACAIPHLSSKKLDTPITPVVPTPGIVYNATTFINQPHPFSLCRAVRGRHGRPSW